MLDLDIFCNAHLLVNNSPNDNAATGKNRMSTQDETSVYSKKLSLSFIFVTQH